MSKDSEAVVANESRKAARRMQERFENMGDIADALYLWNAQMLAGSGCVMMPGDVCACWNGGIASSRGALISMSADEILDLVDGGALSKVFNPDDMNAPDFGDRMRHIFTKVSDQRAFRDAPHYYQRPELHSAVAVYDVPGPTPKDDTQLSVERAGRRFSFVPGVRDDLETMLECTYLQFNPARADIMAEVNGAAPEMRNRSDIFDRIIQAYQDAGSNGVPEAGDLKDPRDEPGFDALPPMERMTRMNAYTDQADTMRRQKAADQTEIDNDIPMPGGRRMG